MGAALLFRARRPPSSPAFHDPSVEADNGVQPPTAADSAVAFRRVNIGYPEARQKSPARDAISKRSVRIASAHLWIEAVVNHPSLVPLKSTITSRVTVDMTRTPSWVPPPIQPTNPLPEKHRHHPSDPVGTPFRPSLLGQKHFRFSDVTQTANLSGHPPNGGFWNPSNHTNSVHLCQ